MSLRKFVRESKFRHVFGQPSPKDQQFDGIPASTGRADGNIVAVNWKFIAVVLVSSGGGVYTVLNRTKPGRYEKLYKCIGHTSEVIDLCFDPFNPHRIISGADDGSFVVWWIPEGGLEADLTEYQCVLRGSQRRAVMACWHTSAADIVFCVNADGFHIFNVETGDRFISVDTSQYSEQLYNISLNYDSTSCATIGKDKKVRVFDVYTGNLKQEFSVHEGSKPSRVAWLNRVGNGQFVVTTGATKMSERQISVWNLSNPSEPVYSENLDNSSPVLSIYYDPDTSLIALFSKGEASVRIYEVDPTGQIYLVALHQAQEPLRAGAFGNKLACNFMNNEIMHFARVLAKSVEEVAFIVPRRSDQFQDDLFPETMGETAAMTAEDFIAGKTSAPVMVSLKGYVYPSGYTPYANTPGRTSTCASSISRSSASFAQKKYPSMSQHTNATGGSNSDLMSEIADLRSELKDLKNRTEQLERALASKH